MFFTTFCSIETWLAVLCGLVFNYYAAHVAYAVAVLDFMQPMWCSFAVRYCGICPEPHITTVQFYAVHVAYAGLFHNRTCLEAQ